MRKPPSPFTAQVFYTIDSSDFDAFIQKHFGQPYESIPANEWSNYSSYNFRADPSRLDKDELDKLAKFEKDGSGEPYVGTLLSVLAKRGVIPTGKYTIRVFW